MPTALAIVADEVNMITGDIDPVRKGRRAEPDDRAPFLLKGVRGLPARHGHELLPRALLARGGTDGEVEDAVCPEGHEDVAGAGQHLRQLLGQALLAGEADRIVVDRRLEARDGRKGRDHGFRPVVVGGRLWAGRDGDRRPVRLHLEHGAIQHDHFAFELGSSVSIKRRERERKNGLDAG